MTIPANFRPANRYDLTDQSGKILPGIKFYIQGYHPEVYVQSGKFKTEDEVPLEEHITTKETNLDKWKDWIEDRRLFVESKIFKAKSTLDYI